jgi:hypothetical protein
MIDLELREQLFDDVLNQSDYQIGLKRFLNGFLQCSSDPRLGAFKDHFRKNPDDFLALFEHALAQPYRAEIASLHNIKHIIDGRT